MTREETKSILMFIDSAYPNFHIENPTFLIDTWSVILEAEDAEEIKKALIVYARTNTSGFAPSPGQLIEIVQKTNNEITEEEAIHLVRKAVCNSLYHAKEEYAKLPELVQKAIGSESELRMWAGCNYADFENVVLSRLRKTFRAVEKREQITRQYKALEQKQIMTETITARAVRQISGQRTGV